MTIAVFKNLSMKRRGTGDHPDYDTFGVFQPISAKLGNTII